jgi:hypothetical protein
MSKMFFGAEKFLMCIFALIWQKMHYRPPKAQKTSTRFHFWGNDYFSLLFSRPNIKGDFIVFFSAKKEDQSGRTPTGAEDISNFSNSECLSKRVSETPFILNLTNLLYTNHSRLILSRSKQPR